MLTIVVSIAALVIAVLQTIIILQLNQIRVEQRDIWARVNHHSHEVACSSDKCPPMSTGRVILTE